MSYHYTINPPLTIQQYKLRTYGHSLNTQRIDKIIAHLKNELNIHAEMLHINDEGYLVSPFLSIQLPWTSEHLGIQGILDAYEALPDVLRESFTEGTYTITDEYGEQLTFTV